MVRFPYTLEMWYEEDASQNPDGSWIEGAHEWRVIGRCNARQNGRAQQIKGQNGDAFLYSSRLRCLQIHSQFLSGRKYAYSTAEDSTSSTVRSALRPNRKTRTRRRIRYRDSTKADNVTKTRDYGCKVYQLA